MFMKQDSGKTTQNSDPVCGQKFWETFYFVQKGSSELVKNILLALSKCSLSLMFASFQCGISKAAKIVTRRD